MSAVVVCKVLLLFICGIEKEVDDILDFFILLRLRLPLYVVLGVGMSTIKSSTILLLFNGVISK